MKWRYTGVVSKHTEEMNIEVIALRLGFARFKDSVGCKNTHATKNSNKADTGIIGKAEKMLVEGIHIPIIKIVPEIVPKIHGDPA